jgi:2-dehydro-3-deoxygluconokinase
MLETDLISVGEQLLKKFKKAKLFATTLRWIKSNNHHQIQGVLYTRQNKELYMSSVYDMPGIIDRIGGGDAFMAGLIHGLNTYTDDYQSTVNFAIASAALKHYIHGDASTSTSYEIENLITGKTSFLDR